ncbi:MAG: hypothetical protein AB7Q97_24620 [Gammaproteobacteria bacterium]
MKRHEHRTRNDLRRRTRAVLTEDFEPQEAHHGIDDLLSDGGSLAMGLREGLRHADSLDGIDPAPRRWH